MAMVFSCFCCLIRSLIVYLDVLVIALQPCADITRTGTFHARGLEQSGELQEEADGARDVCAELPPWPV